MRRWLHTASEALHRHEAELNALNVFPIADSDTGTNMAATLDAAAEASEMVNTQVVGELFGICARHAMECARGNSGTLFAVMLSGMAEPLHTATRLTAGGLAEALEHGRIRVLASLIDPQEGTLLTVLSSMARAAQSWPDREESNRTLISLLEELQRVGQEAVEASEHTLPALRGTGRVDSGALGLLLVMDCLLLTVLGEPYPGGEQRPYAALLAGGRDEPGFAGARRTRTSPAGTGASHRDGQGTGGHGIEFMCRIAADPLDAASIRQDLSDVGDSVIMSAIGPAGTGDAEGTMLWKVHVHVPEAAAAVAVLGRYGRPQEITTEVLTVAEQDAGHDAEEHDTEGRSAQDDARGHRAG